MYFHWCQPQAIAEQQHERKDLKKRKKRIEKHTEREGEGRKSLSELQPMPKKIGVERIGVSGFFFYILLLYPLRFWPNTNNDGSNNKKMIITIITHVQ